MGATEDTLIRFQQVSESLSSPNCATVGGTVSRSESRDTKSICVRLSVIHSPPQAGFPASNAPEKKFNSRPVLPTVRA